MKKTKPKSSRKKKAETGLFQPDNSFTSAFDFQTQAPGYQPQRPQQYIIPEENRLQNVPTFTPSSPSIRDTKVKKDIPWQQYLAPALTAVDALIPNQRTHTPYLHPMDSYNPYSQGTGSTVLAKNGKKMKADDGAAIKKFYTEYLNSPKYKERLQKQGYTNSPQVIQDRLKQVNGLSVVDAPGFGSQFLKDKNKITIDNVQLQKNGFPVSSTIAHEYSHAAGSIGAGPLIGTPRLNNTTLNANEIRAVEGRNKLWNIPRDTYYSYPIDKQMEIDHDRFAGESKADFDSLRYRLYKDGIYNAGKQDFNQDFLKKAKDKYKGDGVLNRVFSNFSDKDIIYIMNNVADNKDSNTTPLDMADNGKKMKADTGLQVEDNQYSQLSPSIMQINGQLHENGGTDLQYGNSAIEAEKGETATIDKDGALTIFGNLKIPNSKMKFKEAGKQLADQENTFMKKGDKYNKVLDKTDDRFSLNSAKVGLEGADINLKKVQQQKDMLSALQESMLKYAQQEGKDPKKLFARNGTKVLADGGKKVPLQDKYTQLQSNVLNALKAKYPGQKFDLKISDEFRDIPKQLAIQQANGFSPSFSLHNLDAAKDFNIYQDGKMLDEHSPLYKQVLHTEAKKLGLYPINVPKDPFHISPVQEGTGHAFTDLITNFPEVTQTDKYKQGFTALEALVTAGKANEQQISDYKQLSGNKGNYTPGTNDDPLPSLDGEVMGETILPGKKIPKQWMPDFPNLPVAPTPPPTPYQYTPQGGFNITPPKDRNIPTNQETLNPLQILPEIYGIASNKVEGVKMQQYAPDLFSDYKVSFQDRINSNNGNFRSLQQAVGDNPEALSVLAGQVYGSNNAIYGDQFRSNQSIASDTYNKNVGILNDAQHMNLGLADQQYVRQEQARSNTKAINHSALNSVASKYLQQEHDNKTLGIYENMYNYRFDPTTGKAINYNPDVDFSSFGNNNGQDNTNPFATQKVTTDKNGAVKSISTTNPAPASIPFLQDKYSPYERFKGNYKKLSNGGIVKLAK